VSRRALAAAALAAALVAASPARGAASQSWDFELYDLADRLYSLARARRAARLVVVDFFAESCAPCKAALPAWRQLQARFAGRGLALVLVAVPDDESDRAAALERVRRYLKEHPLPFPALWDKYRVVAKQYGVARKNVLSVPQLFLIDAGGKLVRRAREVKPLREEIERRLR
jgi:peroxiredoxin